MFSALVTLIYTEITTTFRQAYSWLTPLLFFLMVTCLFPLALGPDQTLLTNIAPAIIWVAALLSILISVGSLFKQEAHEGTLDLLLLSSIPLTVLVLSKTFSHWVTHCLPLILISPLLGFLLHLPPNQVGILLVTLVLGTPILILMGAMGAGLIIGIRGHGLLLPILIMPLYIPVLIFAAGTITATRLAQPILGNLAILGALLLVSLAFAPFMTAMALRIGVK